MSFRLAFIYAITYTPLMNPAIDLKYTICFPLQDHHVLLLHRNKNPWADHWNGVGGKLNGGESPKACVIRETREETGLDLTNEITFTGIVTWKTDSNIGKVGMYTFIAYLPEKQPLWKEEREISEGILAWKPLDWVLDKNNPHVARNIPAFLPHMLSHGEPKEYFCIFNELGAFVKVTVLPLPSKLQTIQ